MSRQLISNNINVVTKILFKKLGLKYNSNIQTNLKQHPDYPSFMAIKHTMNKEGVDSIALKSSFEELRDKLPKPVIVHITTNTDLFLVVEKIDDKYVHIINEKGKIDLETIDTFLKMWNGNVMIFDTENIKRKKETLKEKFVTLLDNIKQPLIVISSILLFSFLLFNQSESRVTINYLIIVISAIGVMFSVLLELEMFDEHNPLIRKICTSGKNNKINCSNILNSKDAYFMGIFSWSDIGTIYFSFILLLNIIYPSSFTTTISICLAILTFPYVFYSIIYQKFIAKSWCRLCLGVQAVLATLFTLSIIYYSSFNYNLLTNFQSLIVVSILFTTILSAFIIVKSLIGNTYKLKQASLQLNTLKHSSVVKNGYMYTVPTVAKTPSCSFVLGNPNGETCFTMVMSPVCNPCMSELSQLIPIFKTKTNTRIELLILCEKEEVAPFDFNLSLNLIKMFIDDKQNILNNLANYVYNYPASKHKLSTQKFKTTNQQAKEILLSQIQWSVNNKMFNTPQMFVNHKKLPSFYSANDIDYLCD